MRGRDYLLEQGWVALFGDWYAPDPGSDTGWRPINRDHAFAAAQDAAANADPDREAKGITRQMVREADAEAFRMSQPEGALAVEADVASVVELQTGEVYPNATVWANCIVTYDAGKVTSRPLPDGTLCAGTGKSIFLEFVRNVVRYLA